MGSPAAPTHGSGGARWFGGLARRIVRRPWVVVAVWVALFLVTVPFLSRLGSVTTSSEESVPSSAPSAVAAARLAELFPNTSGGSSAYLLLYGPNLTDAAAQRLVGNVTAAIVTDRSLREVASVATIYTAYAGYLAGEAELAGEILAPAVTGGGSTLPVAVNGTEALLWGPPADFLGTWETLIANASRTPAEWNPVAEERTAANLSGAPLAVLRDFYSEFNGSLDCAALPATAAACADTATRDGLAGGLAALLGTEAYLGAATLAGAGVANFTAWTTTQGIVTAVVGNESGLPSGWLRTVWTAFPSATVGPGAAARFANATVAATTLGHGPLPVPYGIRSQYVNAASTASLVVVGFAVADDWTNASGGDPVYADLPGLLSVAQAAVHRSDPNDEIAVAETGPAPLDLLTQQAVNSSLELVLPLTVGLLLAIAMLYFRSPLTPLVTFAGLAIALVLGLGTTVLIGTLVEHVDSSALTLEEVFVLGVGTDYSVFLVARYREEIYAGRSSEEAIVTSMSWAGQSVATSGSTAILVTVALALSGVALLSQWGLVLSAAILITMLLSLTLVPASLALIGPRIFWPTTGARFRRAAARIADRTERRATYFYRAGRLGERRAGTILAVALAVSVPMLALALTVPISYDFYGQLPSGDTATTGLAELNAQFGSGFATPSYALVTFAQPIHDGNRTNAAEFEAIANLTGIAGRTSGIAAVTSPVGPAGATLADWLSLPTLKPAVQAELLGVLSGFVGTDGRTVLVSFQTNATGLSTAAVATVGAIQSSWAAYSAAHPGIDAIVYGGAAPVIRDLADETGVATEFMLVAVALGLIAVLVVVLRSWIIALMAVGTIGLSIGWAWALTYLLLDRLLGEPLFFYVRTILIVLVLGLGIDYNIFLLTRVREERLRGRSASGAATEAVARTGGIITAAAIILASAFGALSIAEFTLIRAIGVAVAIAVILDAMVVRTYLVPAALHYLGDRVWPRAARTDGSAGPDGPPPEN